MEVVYPSEIILEVTNRCNLRCMFCHFHGIGSLKKREKGDMNPRLWKKVLDEVKEWQRPVGFATHGAGEPLLYKHLKDLLTSIKKISNASCGFMTNAMLLSREWSIFLVENQIDWVAFSIDGVNPKKHAYYRRGSNLELIERNIDKLIEEKEKRGSNKPELIFNMVVYPGMEAEKGAYLKKWFPFSKKVIFSKFRPMNSKKLWEKQPFKFKPCPMIFRQLVVGFNGIVGLCCEDIHLESPLGDLKSKTVLEVYNGPFAREIREKHLSGNINDLPLCSHCHVWGAETVLERKLLEDGSVFEVTPAYESYTRT